MNQKILFIIIIIAVGIFYWMYKLTPEELKSEYDNTFTFVCNSDKEIKISYVIMKKITQLLFLLKVKSMNFIES